MSLINTPEQAIERCLNIVHTRFDEWCKDPYWPDVDDLIGNICDDIRDLGDDLDGDDASL